MGADSSKGEVKQVRPTTLRADGLKRLLLITIRFERSQLFVGSGVWKASRLPLEDVLDAQRDPEGAGERIGCLITEVCGPTLTSRKAPLIFSFRTGRRTGLDGRRPRLPGSRQGDPSAPPSVGVI